MGTTSSAGQKWGDALPGKHLGGMTAEEEPWQEEKVRQSWSAPSSVHPFSFSSLPSLIGHQPGLNLLFFSWTRLSVVSEGKDFSQETLGSPPTPHTGRFWFSAAPLRCFQPWQRQRWRRDTCLSDVGWAGVQEGCENLLAWCKTPRLSALHHGRTTKNRKQVRVCLSSAFLSSAHPNLGLCKMKLFCVLILKDNSVSSLGTIYHRKM